MKKLQSNSSAEKVIEAYYYLQTRLHGQDISEDINNNLTKNIELLRQADDAWKAVHRERVGLSQELSYLDDIIDDMVYDLSRRVLVITSGDRNASLYKRVFPETPSIATKGVSSEEEIQYVENMINNLRSGEDYSELKSGVDALEVQLGKIKETISMRKALYLKEKEMRNNLNITKDEVISYYNRVYFVLVLKFDEKRAGSFFS